MPIIAVILMLFSQRAGSTSVGFLIGWVLGIVVATGIFTALSGSLTTGGAPSVVVVLDQDRARVCCCSALGARQWRGRQGPHEPPKWMAAIDDFTFSRRSGWRFLLSAINPKNLIMAAGAGRDHRLGRAEPRQRDRRDRGLHRHRRRRRWRSR